MKNLYQILLSLTFFISLPAIAQVPLYNSYPEAAATIYLDFDGQYLEGTSWNMSGPLSLAPSNLNSNQVTEIYKRVSEDYRPFEVNVTTDSTKYWNAPADQRMRIILTITSEWYGSVGGVSYMNSFTWGDNTPAFVFTRLLNYNVKYIAEATSHEAGHTLGLRHQAAYDNSCKKTAEYNAGFGSGEIGWAPIMGVGYYRNFTLWNNGANPYGCTNYQNDLEIITTRNGFGYRNDDFTDNFDGATKINFTNDRFTLSGVIEQNSDVDLVKLSVPAHGRFVLNALPFSLGDGATGANLDLQVELLNQSQTVIGTYNPTNALKTSIDTMISGGTYYLRLQGMGNSNTSEYASLGSYNVEGVFSASIILALQKLELSGFNDGKHHRFDWVIESDEAITKQTLEVSQDGRAYEPMAKLNTVTRSYTYQPGDASLFYYRLTTELANGRQYYSNIITLPVTMSARPFLQGNIALDKLMVNSPAVYDYQLTDFNGRLIASGKTSQGMNRIPVHHLKNGLYMIQFSNGGKLFTEKFMKQ